MKVDQLARKQVEVAQTLHQAQNQLTYAPAPGAAAAPAAGSLYSGLGLEEFLDYGGLNISEQAIMQAMPADVGQQVIQYQQQFTQPIASITPVQDKNIARATIKQGVREVVLAKDQSGKLGAPRKNKKKKKKKKKERTGEREREREREREKERGPSQRKRQEFSLHFLLLFLSSFLFSFLFSFLLFYFFFFFYCPFCSAH